MFLVYNTHVIQISHLCVPPPPSSVHIVEDVNSVVIICIMFFRLKNQKGKEVWVSPKHLQALNDVPSIEFKGLSSNYHLIALEAWTRR